MFFFNFLFILFISVGSLVEAQLKEEDKVGANYPKNKLSSAQYFYKNKSGLQKGIYGDFHIVLSFHVSLLIFLLIPIFSKFMLDREVKQNFYHCSLAKQKHKFHISNQKIISNLTFNFKRSVQMVVEDNCGDTKLEQVS